MSLTLPIQVGKQYVRRDGEVVKIARIAGNLFYILTNGSLGDGYVDTGKAHSDSDKTHVSDLIADHIPATGHPHAALMAQYAADAAETAEPWVRWQFAERVNDWFNCGKHPEWRAEYSYRRKPKTIRIGEHDVPEPVRATPNRDIPYYFPNLDSTALIRGARWSGVEFDHYMLARGLVHLTREAAEQHARALLAFTQVQA